VFEEKPDRLVNIFVEKSDSNILKSIVYPERLANHCQPVTQLLFQALNVALSRSLSARASL